MISKNKSLEFSSVKHIEAAQTRLLQETMGYAGKHSPFYRRILTRKGLRPRDFQSVADLSLLPITHKKHLQQDSGAFYCIGKKDIADIVSTTGTTGEPVFIVLSKNDLRRLARNEVYSFSCAGLTPKDTVHLAVTLDNLFMAGVAYYSGLIELGASVYRVGMHHTERQILLLRQLSPTAIMTVPSFLLRLAQAIRAQGMEPSAFSLKKAVLVGESIRDRAFRLSGIGELLHQAWPLELYSSLGNSEAAVSFCECRYRKGAHEHPEFVISEIVDEQGMPLADGETGELVLTSLQVEGMPLLRYATGDITFKISGPCRCGRHSSRLGPVLGRKGSMLKYKGTKIYPKVIEAALARVEGVANYVIEAYTGDDLSDRIVVVAGCPRPSKKLKEQALTAIAAHARVTPQIRLATVKEVAALQSDDGRARKFRTFIDHRVRAVHGRDEHE